MVMIQPGDRFKGPPFSVTDLAQRVYPALQLERQSVSGGRDYAWDAVSGLRQSKDSFRSLPCILLSSTDIIRITIGTRYPPGAPQNSLHL